MSDMRKTPEYTSWRNMKSRCLNPKASNYKRYGGRGITICERWLHSFPLFLADMGLRPSPAHSLERKDNDGPYSPNNCRWATAKEQCANRHQAKTRAVTSRPDGAARIADRIRELRTRAGLSMMELSRRAGLSESHVGLIERPGEYKSSPRATTLAALARALGVSIEDLLA